MQSKKLPPHTYVQELVSFMTLFFRRLFFRVDDAARGDEAMPTRKWEIPSRVWTSENMWSQSFRHWLWSWNQGDQLVLFCFISKCVDSFWQKTKLSAIDILTSSPLQFVYTYDDEVDEERLKEVVESTVRLLFSIVKSAVTQKKRKGNQEENRTESFLRKLSLTFLL